MSKKFTDAIGQKCDGTGLFLDLNVKLEDYCFYEIGHAGENEAVSNDGKFNFYYASSPGNTDDYITDDVVKDNISKSIFISGKFLKFAFGKESGDYYDSIFSKENVEMSFVYAKLINWLGPKRSLLKTKFADYKWLLENIK